MIDRIIYKIEDLHHMVEFSSENDRGYLLERRGEIVEDLKQLIKRIEDE